MAGYGAEMAFARGVLLVGGEGDRLYFEGLRRRGAQLATDSRLDEICVVPTGSKTRFGPWIRLLSGYGTDADRPINWISLVDGDVPPRFG